MKVLVSVILLSVISPQDSPGQENQLVQGENALAGGLWEIAELQFQKILSDPAATAAEKFTARIRLGETLVRAGSWEKALEILNTPTAPDHPESSFWIAQALAGQGKFAQADARFSKLAGNSNSDFQLESALSLASLLVASNRSEEALGVINALPTSAGLGGRVRSSLYQVKILLDLGRLSDARQSMPKLDLASPPEAAEIRLATARLELGEGKFSDAEQNFRKILADRPMLSSADLALANLGLADGIHGNARADEAIKILLEFLTENPQTSLLEEFFSRIVAWLPANPLLTDPVFNQISQWIPSFSLPSLGPLSGNHTGENSAVAAWSTYVETPENDIVPWAIFARSTLLERVGTPESDSEARVLNNRLCWEFPAHPLASRTQLEKARGLLRDDQEFLALSILAGIRENPNSPVFANAVFLEAAAAFKNGDLKLAAALFEDAGKSFDGQAARVANLNAAIANISNGSKPSLGTKENSLEQRSNFSADIELEVALTLESPAEKRSAIETFLQKFPDHRRASEARLEAADSALAQKTPDLSFARAQLETIAADAPAIRENGARVALAKLRIADEANDVAAVRTEAGKLMEQFADEPESDEAAMVLGRNLFASADYNQARLVLEKLAATTTDTALRQAAWLLAARSADLGGTPQSREQALNLYEKALAIEGPLASLAKLEKARHLIDTYQLAGAVGFLTGWIKNLPPKDALHFPAGLLLGEALYAQGALNPKSLEDALLTYDRLLVLAKSEPSLYARLQYLRGKTFENLSDPNAPGNNREKEAFQAYHSVLELAEPPAEWEYFELCGFRALQLLEKAKRWQAAITVAQKIASFNGPRATEAAARANEIQLKEMIY